MNKKPSSDSGLQPTMANKEIQSNKESMINKDSNKDNKSATNINCSNTQIKDNSNSNSKKMEIDTLEDVTNNQLKDVNYSYNF